VWQQVILKHHGQPIFKREIFGLKGANQLLADTLTWGMDTLAQARSVLRCSTEGYAMGISDPVHSGRAEGSVMLIQPGKQEMARQAATV
jgi:hypothetical protein